eukprot:m.273292 g.273292  ORF g.273292 m.273292 type:complete len:108 (+) comp19339_c0_seq3:1912-2235(+)
MVCKKAQPIAARKWPPRQHKKTQTAQLVPPHVTDLPSHCVCHFVTCTMASSPDALSTELPASMMGASSAWNRSFLCFEATTILQGTTTGYPQSKVINEHSELGLTQP